MSAPFRIQTIHSASPHIEGPYKNFLCFQCFQLVACKCVGFKESHMPWQKNSLIIQVNFLQETSSRSTTMGPPDDLQLTTVSWPSMFWVTSKHFVFLGHMLYILSSHVVAYKMYYLVGTNFPCTGKSIILIRQDRWQEQHAQLKPLKETL